MFPRERYRYSGPRLKVVADFPKIEDLRKKQREGKMLSFYEKQRIQRDDEENRKKNASKKKK